VASAFATTGGVDHLRPYQPTPDFHRYRPRHPAQRRRRNSFYGSEPGARPSEIAGGIEWCAFGHPRSRQPSKITRNHLDWSIMLSATLTRTR
jgi:hypothetical protein